MTKEHNSMDNLLKGRAHGCKSVRINALSLAKMMAALMDGHGKTYAELHEICGLNRVTMWDYITRLRAEGCAYVHHYEEDKRGGLTVLAFAIGKKKDAPRPGRKENAQRASEYRARVASAKLLGLVSRREVTA